MKKTLLSALILAGIHFNSVASDQANFKVNPYLQNPTPTSMTIMWVTTDDKAGELTVSAEGFTETLKSTPTLAKELDYYPTEVEKYFTNQAETQTPYIHRITIDGLKPGTQYQYEVAQGSEKYAAHFTTVPNKDSSVRFVVYSDSETEPESTGKTRRWSEPYGDFDRQYLVDQTVGYQENIRVMLERQPNFIAIAGDLVESGNEQRDWDEFWRHNAGEYNNIASYIPILPALGNHENYPGPDGGMKEYNTELALQAIARYKAYFDVPDNGSKVDAYKDRFYRVDYGPITFITLDTSDGKEDKTDKDTNWRLPGVNAPDFNPGSEQYEWLEKQLADAQKNSQFTFVQFHHVPYSVGPHGFPTGNGGFDNGQDNQSGVPVRILTPLFAKYGVDAVFAGHDEMYEHSLVEGVHFYDTGTGGDGLRGPYFGKDGKYKIDLDNPYQQFLAHLDAPEVWKDKQLVSGGKHYGHMEVNVFQNDQGVWTTEISPVYVFPIMDKEGEVTGWERRVYQDVVTLTAQ